MKVKTAKLIDKLQEENAVMETECENMASDLELCKIKLSEAEQQRDKFQHEAALAKHELAKSCAAYTDQAAVVADYSRTIDLGGRLNGIYAKALVEIIQTIEGLRER